MTTVSDFNNDLEFSNQSFQAWKEFLHEYFGEKLFEVQFREEKQLQLCYWDCILIFNDGQQPLRIELKTRRFYAYENFYKKDHKRVIETRGNVDTNKLGSAIFNSNAELWAIGFFDGKKIHAPLVFECKPFAKRLQFLMRTQPFKYKEIKNKSTNGLYQSAFVLVPENLIYPFVYPKKKTDTLWDWVK